jgi:hypothetical protein
VVDRCHFVDLTVGNCYEGATPMRENVGRGVVVVRCAIIGPAALNGKDVVLQGGLDFYDR